MPKLKLGKLSRREGIALSPRPSIARVMQKRAYGPGVQGANSGGRRRRVSSYGQQLREKQKAKLLYNLREKQFRKYYEDAVKKDGNTADLLLQSLEMRLENVVYRLGFAKTRQQARQMVSHKFFTVDGTTVNIRSYRVKPGEEIAIKETKRKKNLIPEILEHAENQTVPSWLSVDTKGMSGRVLSEPAGEDLQQPFDPKLIIEFYSR